jgi:hypothetical protein
VSECEEAERYSSHMKIGGIGCFSFPLKGLEHLSKCARKGSREARIALMKLKMEQAIEPRY